MIQELSEIKIIDNNIEHNLFFPNVYWINNIDNWNDISIEITDDDLNNIILRPFKNENFIICSEKDLETLFLSHKLKISEYLVDFRIKLVETKKWGIKPLFDEGQNAICFSCFQLETIDYKFLMFYNKSGTKSVESIYFHGLWKLKK